MIKMHRKIAVTMIALNIVTGYASSQISGTKSVGTGGEYETLSAAIADVMANGINGQTVLELKDGYDQDEYVLIGHYPGNDLYHLTIRPEEGASQALIRRTLPLTVKMDSARHVIIDGRAGGNGSQNVLNLISEFEGNGTALWISNGCRGNVIRNCNISFNCTRGVAIYDSDSTTVTECDISTYSNGPTNNGGTYGIYARSCTNSIISNNWIHQLHVNHDNFLLYGIAFENIPADGSTERLFNNFICINTDRSDSTSQLIGISIWSGHQAQNPIDILFNTVYIGGTNTSGTNSYGIYNYSAERMVNIRNNIVINERTNSSGSGSHYAFCKHEEYGSWTSDYNLLMVNGNGGLIGYYAGIDCETLLDWQNTTSCDSHSVSKPVVFTDPGNGDLHLTEVSMDDPDLKCLPVAGITTDIDGDLRNSTNPFKGADELVIPQTPYLGAAFQLPCRIELEDYDMGGMNVAYWDSDAGNTGGQYRDDDVDIETSFDTDGGYDLCYTEDNEWLEYTVNGTGEAMDVEVRAATIHSDRKCRLVLDGDTLCTVDLPNTGGWQTWETATVKNIMIPEGTNQILRFEIIKGWVNLNWIEFTPSSGTGLSEDTAMPLRFALGQAYPNPFNPETTIRFDVKEPCQVVLKVYNLMGQKVIDLVNKDYQPGVYEVKFNAAGFPSDIYFYRIQMGSYHAVKKMVVLK